MVGNRTDSVVSHRSCRIEDSFISSIIFLPGSVSRFTDIRLSFHSSTHSARFAKQNKRSPSLRTIVDEFISVLRSSPLGLNQLFTQQCSTIYVDSVSHLEIKRRRETRRLSAGILLVLDSTPPRIPPRQMQPTPYTIPTP